VTETSAGTHRTGAHRAPPSRRRVLLGVAAVVVLVLVSTLVVVLLRTEDGGDTDDAGPAAADGPLGDAAEGLAGWVDAELPADVPLTAPGQVRDALAAAGTAADRLVADDVGALRVVEGDPGADAVVVARFQAGDGVLLSVVDPAPLEPTPEELERRRSLAAALLANPVAGITGRSADVLEAADIDARLLGLVAVLVARLDAGVADLPRAPGQPEEGTPARRALIDRVGEEPLVPGSDAVERVREFIAAQQYPFAPDTVEVTEQGVLVSFDYASSPDAAVTAATE
jgi:hypothetical protein